MAKKSAAHFLWVPCAQGLREIQSLRGALQPFPVQRPFPRSHTAGSGKANTAQRAERYEEGLLLHPALSRTVPAFSCSSMWSSAGNSAAKLGDTKSSKVTQTYPGAEPEPVRSPYQGRRLMLSDGIKMTCAPSTINQSFKKLEDWDHSLLAQGLPQTWPHQYLLHSIQGDGLSQL